MVQMQITLDASESSINGRVARRALSGERASGRCCGIPKPTSENVTGSQKYVPNDDSLGVAADKMNLPPCERVWKEGMSLHSVDLVVTSTTIRNRRDPTRTCCPLFDQWTMIRRSF